jgi:hypothetical protein
LHLLGQVKQVFSGRFRHQNNPWDGGVFMEQYVTEREFADAMAVGKKLLMNLKGRHFVTHGAKKLS